MWMSILIYVSVIALLEFFLIIIPPLPTVNSLTASTNGQSSNGKADGGGDNAEENGGVMNNIMSDIQNGFVHRRLPDGGFKVCR